MGRQTRNLLNGGFYHCINRGVGKRTLFHDKRDYEVFLYLMRRCLKGRSIRVASYCLMPNHWHIVLAADVGADMSKFFAIFLNSHTKHYHARYDTIGQGPIYQGRFKSIAVKDRNLVAVCRYVERNATAARLVGKAVEWPWSSHRYWIDDQRASAGLCLERPFYYSPDEWRELVDTAMTATEIDKVKR